MTKTKILLLSLAIATVIGLMGFAGIQTLTQQIYDARSCEWANIDNIEMHARIDIPETESCQCEYDEATHEKKAAFSLAADLDVEAYARKNNLKPIAGDLPKHVATYAGIGTSEQDLFVRQDSYQDGEHCELLFDPSSRKLWVYLKYLD